MNEKCDKCFVDIDKDKDFIIFNKKDTEVWETYRCEKCYDKELKRQIEVKL